MHIYIDIYRTRCMAASIIIMMTIIITRTRKKTPFPCHFLPKSPMVGDKPLPFFLLH